MQHKKRTLPLRECWQSLRWNNYAFHGHGLSLLAHLRVHCWDWDCALLVPSKNIAITRPIENLCSHWSLRISSSLCAVLL